MLLLFAFRVSAWPSILEKKTVHSVYCNTALSFVNVYQILCVPFFSFGIQGGMWDVIV